ncbi:hypothetical protein DICPUDRAFT_156014 [Dictyostelium purpureum]|uniref:tryptophan--tRNA ligase n=1 Tax=Dictyostelium purpureum TaxID=5786 RepID=F0ZVG8_DICPU|nr:uncharacterized protein DICPUDRAFT_156014 [Dictyostelium purpureum]EGC32062.1 hypothetical protein DICPUDRAFT_156014 [Dictyostelium purpureum]|eukprot:XP_003291416.1 hypothetical protein DICPUDRAFT_156014 [Dictyostelium purpureum]
MIRLKNFNNINNIRSFCTQSINKPLVNLKTSIEEINFDEKRKVTVFSGMQPTSAALHLGNYLGAMDNWLKIQDLIAKHNEVSPGHKLIFSIVDLHSLTATKTLSPKELHSNTLSVAINYLASGIDPQKVILFNQSMVAAHSELTWIFNCIASFSKLSTMVQFKEKSKSNSQSISNGLLSYPVLMAADILLYRATHVPVGDDQTQHIEFTREIVNSFHHTYKKKYFPLPTIISSETSKRIMSLQDGRVKMSKSDPSDLSRISLTDTDEMIQMKIKKSKTDSIIGISYDIQNRPDISNLLSIASVTSGVSIADLEKEFKDKQNSHFKDFVSQSIISKVKPIREKINYYQANEKIVRDILLEGSDKANQIAINNLKQIKDIIGLYH